MPILMMGDWYFSRSEAVMNRNLLLTVLLLLFAGRALALADDRNQPLTIKADQVEINQKSGTSTYQGHVEFQQGSLHISADSIIVQRHDNEVSRIQADGTPVLIRQRPAPNKEETRAEARHIDYDLKRGLISLSGQAHVWQEGNQFSGETITYESDKGLVTAHGAGEGGKGRVEVIIQPRKEEPAK
jgi:lipopolysaccharide export system protein LptA